MKLPTRSAPHRKSVRFIWFIIIVVTVSVLGWMHRFERVDPELFLPHEGVEEYVMPRRKLQRKKEPEHAKLRIATDQAQAKLKSLQEQIAEATKALEDAKAAKVKIETETAQAMGKAQTFEKIQAIDEDVDDSSEEVEATTINNNATTEGRQVYFMNITQLDQKDTFSASWLQRTEDFLPMQLDKISICEDAAFWAFNHKRRRKLRMTLDWLDFSVEHLSKWWKMLQIYGPKQVGVYDTAMARFDKYLSKAAAFPMEKERSFRETIAVIAYQPMGNLQEEKGFNVTMKSLGSTIESLRRAGFGRVVVVGDNPDDFRLTQSTFRLIQSQLEPQQNVNPTEFIAHVGHMEVGYARFNPKHAVTKHQKKNVPKATLDGLKEAFTIRDQKEPLTQEQKKHMKIWLGDKLDWKYVYLTEPDSILQFRPSTLKHIKEQVDQGMVLVPHRLQPIPHEVDAAQGKNKHLYLPNREFNVMDLDSMGEGDSCCDAHLGPDHRPGKTERPSCGKLWFMCGFGTRGAKEARRFDRIKEYSLIRLNQGTEIVTLAGGGHGRPCIPKKNDACLPPDLEN